MKDTIGPLKAPKRKVTTKPKAAPLGTCQGGRMGFSKCRNPAKEMVVPRDYNGTPKGDARPMCGVHRAQNARYEENGKRYAAGRAAEKERQQRVSYATNVAMMLGQAISVHGPAGINFDVNYKGTVVSTDVASAERLFKWITERNTR